MTNDWSLESILPNQLRIPQLGSPQGMVNNWIQYSIQDDVFSVPTYVPTTSSAISSVLEAALDDRHIEESLNRAKMAAYQLQLQHSAMGEREKNDPGKNVLTQHGAYRRMVAKTSGLKSSLYRGVTKCNEERFEAFVWDNTISERGRTVDIGGYSTEIEAAKAHDLVSIKIYGESTLTNFPVRCYWKEIYEMQKMTKREFILTMRRKGKGSTGRDSPYRGVNRILGGRRWQAWLGQDNGLPRIFLGTYYTAEDAARAYDIALIKFKGMDAITNFDLSTYEVKGIIESTIRRPTVKALSTMNELFLQRGGSNEASSSSSLHQYNHQQLINNSSSSFRGYQNPDLIQSSNPSILGGLTGTGYGVRTNGNSPGNYVAMFPNQGATLEQSLLLGSGQDFQAPQAQQNQLNYNINNEFHQNLLNNQSFHQNTTLPFVHGNQNLGLQDELNLPDLPSDSGSQLLGGDMEIYLSNALNVESPMFHMVNENPGPENGVSSIGLHSEGIHQVEPSNQEFEATQLQIPILDQIPEPHEYQPNNMDQNPNQKSSFSNSCFQNLCSETNTCSPSQMIESLDDFDLSQYLNNSGDSLQNPCSETNTGSQMTEIQDDLDIRDYLNSSYDSFQSFQNPYSATITGSQSDQMTGSQDDLDISQLLDSSYIIEETDWFGDSDEFWAAMEVDNGL